MTRSPTVVERKAFLHSISTALWRREFANNVSSRPVGLEQCSEAWPVQCLLQGTGYLLKTLYHALALGASGEPYHGICLVMWVPSSVLATPVVLRRFLFLGQSPSEDQPRPGLACVASYCISDGYGTMGFWVHNQPCPHNCCWYKTDCRSMAGDQKLMWSYILPTQKSYC